MRSSPARIAAVVAALSIAFPSLKPAIAQDDGPAVAPPAAGQACELHAWPANSLRSTYHGWLHGGINDGAVQGRDGYKLLPPDPLSTLEQAKRLRTVGLANLLQLNGYRLVVHDEALLSADVRRAKGRLVAGTPSCYAEFVTDDVFFQQDIVDGRFLKVLFRFRTFDGADTPSFSFGTYAQRRLTLFPPKEREVEEASFAELSDQFAEAIGEFGAALNAPPKTKKSKRSKN